MDLPPASLKRNSITALQAMVISVAFAAPAVSMFFNTSVAVGFTGAALPFVFLVSTLAIALLANSLAEFSRKVPSSGYAYSFVSRTFGPKPGFMASWTTVICFQMATVIGPPVFGFWTSSLLHSLLGINIPWVALAIFLLLVIWGATVAGIRESVQVDLVFLAIEVIVVAGFALDIIFRGGAHGNDLATLLPTSALSVSGMLFGMVYGILSFQGFESATTLGEEAKEPKRAIPRALYGAIILTGFFYVLVSYAATIGFGAGDMKAYAGDASPFLTLAHRFGGSTMVTMIGIIAIVGLISNSIAALNAGARVYFSMARESMLPQKLAAVHSTRQTPYGSLTANVIIAGVVGIAFGLLWGPMTVWGVFGGVIGVSAILLYITINISLGFLYARQYRSEFRVLRHVIWPVLSTLLFLLPLYSSVWPVPPYPYNLVPYILFAWIIVGAIYLRFLNRRHPDLVARAGQVMAD